MGISYLIYNKIVSKRVKFTNKSKDTKQVLILEFLIFIQNVFLMNKKKDLVDALHVQLEFRECS